MSGVPPTAFLVALVGLPRMGPARLAALVRGRTPAEAWAEVHGGRALSRPEVRLACGRHADDIAAEWRRVARLVDVEEVLDGYERAGVAVLAADHPAFPPVLRDDPEPPLVLFARGALDALDGPAVAVVGTRRCTHYGRSVAFELGRELAGHGIRVVSGLASGIDGAAHRGVLAAGGAPPIAVVGTGLDVPYPPANTDLWHLVAAAGLVLSEAALGAPPDAWRFPARNRIIAALAHVVVVVESHAAGGSMYTVDAAHLRDRPVLAVPGPITSPASGGTNDLLAEGCHPVRSVDDVLIALGLAGVSRRVRVASGAGLAPGERAVLDALVGGPALLEQVGQRCGLELGEAAQVLARLEGAGLVRVDGAWFEREAQ